MFAIGGITSLHMFLFRCAAWFVGMGLDANDSRTHVSFSCFACETRLSLVVGLRFLYL